MIKKIFLLPVLLFCLCTFLEGDVFDFELKNVYPKIITPAAMETPGVNNFVFFQFSNLGNVTFRIKIFDLEGRNVNEIQTSNSNWKVRNSTDYYVKWNCRDYDNQLVLPGAYVYLVETGKKYYTGVITVAR